jgi:hypothetical protein
MNDLQTLLVNLLAIVLLIGAVYAKRYLDKLTTGQDQIATERQLETARRVARTVVRAIEEMSKTEPLSGKRKEQLAFVRIVEILTEQGITFNDETILMVMREAVRLLNAQGEEAHRAQ